MGGQQDVRQRNESSLRIRFVVAGQQDRSLHEAKICLQTAVCSQLAQETTHSGKSLWHVRHFGNFMNSNHRSRLALEYDQLLGMFFQGST